MEDFDTLRREATKLERHLEDRVSRYQQLAQKLNTQDKSLDSLLNSAETGSAIPTEEEAALRNDIHRTLSALSDLIQTRLAPAAERSGKSQHQLLVKRYREILFDLTGDFQKTSAQFTRRKEQLELFAGANAAGGGSGGNEQDEAMQHLMRERGHINNSISASADVINQASEIHSDLRTQGMSLRGVQGTIVRITSNIPGLNRVVENIRRRRSMDDKIVSGVIASCILFTLWYLFG
mmetsp:Transcript_4282/g.7141  ORF Transcript_4282/g.7141 Transcript_4282/m.7141 type:complete len:236 (+) Transcript_4282:304-1011(+)|eukprot:CAMPEP_0119003254 /NCGR_PEP_ID=MMETSP1176-20130426/451_1 /TAXON_ID=265551 /ORGANISM="Synedropsis recta cf, Strain CCMP1620" /LENGTH=235 /DNA_ID=CAMNT_0006954833 /DNA_START=305 /DNA_END=1015 /DNA_ORIENTATION=+